MKFTYGCLVFILGALSIVSPVLAGAGVRLPPPEARIITFEPGASYTFEFEAIGNEYLDVSLGGDLAEYATIEDPNPGGGPRPITLHFTLPDTLPAGEHKVWVTVTEAAPGGGGMGGRAAARAVITVRSLYDYPFLKGTLVVKDVANGSSTTAEVRLKSWSFVDIPGVYAEVVVLKNGEELVRGRTRSITLKSDAEEVLTADLATQHLSPGPYQAEATVYYGNTSVLLKDSFRIGSLEFTLLHYPKQLVAGSVRPFPFTILSNWNDEIPTVYGVVSLFGRSEQTPTISVGPFSKGRLKTFLDLSAVAPGVYNGSITLFYDGETASFPIELRVTEEKTEEEGGSVASSSSVFLSPLIFIYFFTALLLLLLVFFLFLKRK